MQKRAPYRAKNIDEVCELVRDNYCTQNGWILCDSGSHVTTARQQDGKAAEAMVSLPRHEFTRLVRWYMRPQRIAKRAE